VAWLSGTVLVVLILAIDCSEKEFQAVVLGQRVAVPWRLVALPAVGYGLIGAAATIMIPSIPGMDTGFVTEPTLGLSTLSVSALCGRILFSYIFDRGARAQTVAVTLTMLGLSFSLLLLYGQSYSAYILSVALFGASYGGILPTALVYLRIVYPFRKVEASALMFVSGGVGIAIGAVVSGVIGTVVDIYMTLMLATCASGVGALLWMWFIFTSRDAARL
jgi:predicted MFS family arabinose efflux permease